MTAYYNEHDPSAAAWLRELIKAGHIADGDVDERDILDVRPADVAGFRQCHFFAGVGVWSYALRQAGWPDDRPVWTGSAPCQPFSAAGRGAGFADERHLWPAFFHLIDVCRPDALFGEQVASKDGLAWLDLVLADLEGAGYAVGAVDTCAAGFGAPHIRQRLYWTAQRLADAERIGRERGRTGETGGRQSFEPAFGSRDAGGLADATGPRHPEAGQHERGPSQLPARPAEHGGVVRPAGPTNGFWRDADWLYCRDGKWRPVESGTSPLAHGAPARLGRLRGYGNAIVATQATAFIQACMSEAA